LNELSLFDESRTLEERTDMPLMFFLFGG